jgi:hypothetical protein
MPDAPEPSFITHFWRPAIEKSESKMALDVVDVSKYKTTTLMESRTTIESGTTGLRTWLASFSLSRYLMSHPGSGVIFLCLRCIDDQQILSKVKLSWSWGVE